MPADSDHLVANRVLGGSTQRVESVAEQGPYAWVKSNRVGALLLVTIVGTLVYFFGVVPLFIKGTFTKGMTSVAGWAWQAWTGNQEHSRLVPFISLGLVWYHRKKIKEAEKHGSNKGLVFLGVG